MANAYLDTPFGDSDDEWVYTVGTSDATNGNSSTDTARVIAQRGRKNIPLCSNPFCIFAQDSKRYPPTAWVSMPVSGYTVTQ